MLERPVVSQLFRLLSDFGVRDVVCSPGSRNATLLQMADACPEFRKRVVVDERSAAFIGLGLALVSRSPVALICTSGTALLNYAPAVAEAYYQGIPLVVVSADRPLEWIDQDDSQTIRQPGALGNIVKASYDIDGDESREDYVWYANRIVNEGLLTALQGKEGPVHFNVRLDGTTSPEITPAPQARKVRLFSPLPTLGRNDIKGLASVAFNKRILLVAGFMQPDNRLQKSVATLAGLPNVAIMAETLSNLHLPDECYMVDKLLFPLDAEGERELRPDIVISIGGALVSRKLKEFIRRNPPHYNWNVALSPNVVDCFKSLTSKIDCSPTPFLGTLAKMIRRFQRESTDAVAPRYAAEVSRLRERFSGKTEKTPWSDLKAMSLILGGIPVEANLFLSNGTAVRYAQIVPFRLPHAVYSNRGVSGIEGSTSTALGGSLIYGKITCLITGDTSFAYDMAAFASLPAPSTMRVVLLDNGGGDIFRFIPATNSLPIRERYLCTDIKANPSFIADAYGWDYIFADSEASLRKALKGFFKSSSRPSILHVSTGRGDKNTDILRNFLNNK